MNNINRIMASRRWRKPIHNPAPMPMPSAAVTQIIAAVVIPFTPKSPLKITPAPTKPMPVAILDAMRSGLDPSPISCENTVNRADPRQIRVRVRKPADLLRYCASTPIAPPIRMETRIFSMMSGGSCMQDE